jgi:hypothetical protein
MKGEGWRLAVQAGEDTRLSTSNARIRVAAPVDRVFWLQYSSPQ